MPHCRCKFPQTDVVGDDLVYFTLIETLYCIVRSPVKHFLSNDSIWEITTRCYSNIFTSSGPMRTNRQHGNNADNGSSRALLVQLSEKALISAVQLVFSSDSVEFWKKVKERTATAKSGAGLSVEKEMETGGEAKGVGPPLFTSYNRISSSALNEGSGLPETSNAKRMLPFDEVGAMKVFRFFVAMLSRYTTLFSCLSEQNTGSGVGLVPSSNGASSKTSSARHFANLHTSSTSSSSKVSASLSGGCICLNDDIGGIYNSIYTVDRSKSVKEMTENDVALARSIIGSSSGISEMLLSLKVIKSVLTSSNGTSAIQQICISYPEFVWEISDSLGKCLILLATKRSYPSIVLQYILSIFGELVAAMSPVLKVLVENFVTQVYLKALHQVLCCLVEHVSRLL